MYSALRSILAVGVLMLSSPCGTLAFPQAVNFIRHAVDPLPLVNKSPGLAPCTRDRGTAVAALDAATRVTSDAGAPCETSSSHMPSVNQCTYSGTAPMECDAPRDRVQEDLEGQGKTGQKILRARRIVLEILQTENVCSAWFRELDPNPAATFRTLNYAVERPGEERVHVSRDAATQFTFREPYVARVGQDTGAYATITLNAGGAFFQLQAVALEVSKEGGIAKISGPRSVKIGPYPGDSVAGQTLALLHEFGHVINLLPLDFANEDGKSVENTAEVLRFCRAEIESKVRRGTLQATR
jgi:hypothetical protein